MNLEMDAEAELDEKTEVKLRIPKRQRLCLHWLKIMKGDTMSDIVQEALTRYMEEEGHEVG